MLATTQEESKVPKKGTYVDIYSIAMRQKKRQPNSPPPKKKIKVDKWQKEFTWFKCYAKLGRKLVGWLKLMINNRSQPDLDVLLNKLDKWRFESTWFRWYEKDDRKLVGVGRLKYTKYFVKRKNFISQ